MKTPVALARKRHNHGAGFGIIEYVITVNMLAITVVIFSYSAINASRMFLHQRYMTQAISIADVTTEELLLMDTSDDDLVTGAHERYYGVKGTEVSESNAFFTATWTNSSYDDVPGIRQVVVVVAWAESGSQKQIQWSTYRN